MDKILVVDFGGQYAHLIANRIRRLGVYSEIAQPNVKTAELKHRDVKGIILSGGPNSVYAKDAPKYNSAIFTLGVPILGICYGHQLMANHLKGIVSPGVTKEYGFAEITPAKSKLFKGLSKQETVWMSHGDKVESVPEGFVVTASTSDCVVAAMADEKRNFFGVQFHPEVTHTKHGMKILKNFVGITGAKKNWSMNLYLKQIKTEIKQRTKDRNVFLLVSGGVDSSVCFALLNSILGPKRVLGLHIDNGFMRKDESKSVMIEMQKHGFDNLNIYNASDGFLSKLKGVVKPEEKRHLIGDYFIDVYKQAVKDLNLDSKKWMLAQGTIYPDTIETGGTKHSALIKTHHNRVPLLQKMIKQGLVLEPLAGLYKDEVRELGLLLGLPKNLVFRHPFPGPGLAVRCLCSGAKSSKTIKLPNGYIAPIKSVGVQGDFRTYRHPAIILPKKLDYAKLEKDSTKMTNADARINRVLLQLYPLRLKQSSTFRATLTKDRLNLLREADAIVTKILIKHKLYGKIWQMPVVLVPYGNKDSIVLRPIESTEAMTARFFRLPSVALKDLVKELSKLSISHIFFDITNKPPATIEWE